MPDKPDWNTRYVQGDTPWERGLPSRELGRVLDEWQIAPCRALEMGCGTGSDAVYLAGRGFDVTAFDLAPLAIERAAARAGQAGVTLKLLAGDYRSLADLGPPYAFVFDAGFYHCVRREGLGDLLAFVERITRSGSLWLSLLGNANDPQPQDRGPPRLGAAELCGELEPLFALVQLREIHFESTQLDARRPLAWSALWRRR